MNDDVYNSGHVRVFIFLDNSWLQLGDDVEVDSVFAHFGTSVALLFDGLTLAVGSPGGRRCRGKFDWLRPTASFCWNRWLDADW